MSVRKVMAQDSKMTHLRSNIIKYLSEFWLVKACETGIRSEFKMVNHRLSQQDRPVKRLNEFIWYDTDKHG